MDKLHLYVHRKSKRLIQLLSTKQGLLIFDKQYWNMKPRRASDGKWLN